TVQISKPDAGARSSAPANYTFTAGDNGVHIFAAGVTLVTVGNQTVSATDTVSGSITGTSNSITVSAAVATHFTVSAPGSTTAGSLFGLTVTALDQFGNVATGYLGTVVSTKSDAGAGSAVPANYAFTGADNGVHTFSNAAILVTAASQTITATDTTVGTTAGVSNSITVSAASATHLAVSAPSNATAGSAFDITVTALDQFN